jgi:hypothetical protein
MQHLLRTVTRSHVRPSLPDADLKLLFTTVKNARTSVRLHLSFHFVHSTHVNNLPQGQHSDSKLSDPFYDALENILTDLRTVTMVSLSFDDAEEAFHIYILSHRIIETQRLFSSLCPSRKSTTIMMV